MTATANPHTLRRRVTACPTGLQQWSGAELLDWRHPTLDTWVTEAPKVLGKGRRRHLCREPIGQGYSSVNVQYAGSQTLAVGSMVSRFQDCATVLRKFSEARSRPLDTFSAIPGSICGSQPAGPTDWRSRYCWPQRRWRRRPSVADLRQQGLPPHGRHVDRIPAVVVTQVGS